MSTPAVLPPTPPNENAFPVSSSKDLSASNMATASPSIHPEQNQHIWIITGPAGCGKTSVAEHLHRTFGMPYLEGDVVSFFHFACCFFSGLRMSRVGGTDSFVV
jgi:hypothetical protein